MKILNKPRTQNTPKTNCPNIPDKSSWVRGKKVIGIIILIIAAVLLAIFVDKKIRKTSEISEANILEESGLMKKSASNVWWLNSGGIAGVNGDIIASTNLGALPKNSYWQKLYAKNNSRDTDGGYYPQNIFRLVTRNKYENLTQSMYFYIEKTNLSQSDYRNESNGILFFNRYQDGDNLYYTGFRVDGNAVIKKKINGKYYTLAEKDILTNSKKYDRVKNPNLIPEKDWIGIKSEVKNIDKETVDIKLYINKEGKEDWQLILETQDKKDEYGKAPFLEDGYAGIRTDFMDVKFRDYSISEN